MGANVLSATKALFRSSSFSTPQPVVAPVQSAKDDWRSAKQKEEEEAVGFSDTPRLYELFFRRSVVK